MSILMIIGLVLYFGGGAAIVYWIDRKLFRGDR